MGDRTCYSLSIVSALPLAVVREVIEVFTEGSCSSREADAVVEEGRLFLTIPERLVGEARECAEAVREVLVAAGFDVPFAVTEDPKYEWLGTLCRYHPVLGFHVVDCDGEGRVVVDEGALQSAMRARGAEDFVRWLAGRLGIAWVGLGVAPEPERGSAAALQYARARGLAAVELLRAHRLASGLQALLDAVAAARREAGVWTSRDRQVAADLVLAAELLDRRARRAGG